MKHNLFLAATMLLCLLILAATFPVFADEEAAADQLVQIQQASYDPESGLLTVNWLNSDAQPVTEAEFRINPLNADGCSLVIGEGYIEEILLEERVMHAAVTAESGQTISSVFQVGGDYPDTVNVNIAVDRVVRTVYAEDGTIQEQTVQELPDDRLCWFSTRQNAYTAGPENETSYEMPSEDVLRAAEAVRLGFTVFPVPGELAEAYGFACGGMIVVSVEEGSAAEAIGLEPWDLIYSVNDLLYATDPYFIARGIADLAAGRPMTMLFERDNALWEVSLGMEE